MMDPSLDKSKWVHLEVLLFMFLSCTRHVLKSWLTVITVYGLIISGASFLLTGLRAQTSLLISKGSVCLLTCSQTCLAPCSEARLQIFFNSEETSSPLGTSSGSTYRKPLGRSWMSGLYPYTISKGGKWMSLLMQDLAMRSAVVRYLTQLLLFPELAS